MANTNKIIDLDLSVTKKKQFRINGDDNRMFELNTSDMGIITRTSEVYPKLVAQQEKAGSLLDDLSLTDETILDEMPTISERLKEIDQEMRDLIDYMFNAEVSKALAPDGSMYDPFEGSFRFEYVISVLMAQYADNLQYQYGKMEKQFKKHTSKYTKGNK